ncbi:LysR family transcriptional regulator [Marinomonas mediterranea]|uniref:LysR family transcriptional regulator n=1 Tax=Marinomonas mediterranea TaxID=119864 RepID=UPI00234967B1|nr:LysR family transcriptional regulator [Marinomonas mediterranea]WCN15327.1 LysR family transcriptional regulator [Marinomonas mediterranea]
MSISLDVEAVRAFVVIAELKSFTLAANSLGTSQATLSLRLKRLEQRINRRLIERTPRVVRLSSQGESFIGNAKAFLEAHDKAVETLYTVKNRLRLGIGCHIIGSELTAILAKVNTQYPNLTLEISTGLSSELKQQYDEGTLDAVIVNSEEYRKQGHLLCIEHYSWFATPKYKYKVGDSVKLATLDEKCEVRDQAPVILKSADIPFQKMLIGGNTDIVNSAILAGMAIGVYALRLVPEGLIDVRSKFNLPALPTSSIELHTHLTDIKTRNVLKEISHIFKLYNGTTL